MGDHDQGLIWNLHPNEHRSIQDDGRILSPIREDEYLRTYDEYGRQVGDGLPSYAREVFLFRGKEFVPDMVLQVHGEKFTPTKWESRYSTLSSTATEREKFTPVIDDNHRIVGHLGWVGGYDIFVPRETIGELSPARIFFEKARLDEWDRQLAASHDRPFGDLPGPRVSTIPSTPRPVPCWPGNKPAGIAPLKPGEHEALWNSLVKAGPGKDISEENRLRENINFFVAGGGTAIVGEQWDALPHEPTPKLERYLLGPGLSSPGYSPFTPTIAALANPSPYYRFLTLVGPDGLIQAVFRAEMFQPESREDKILRVGLVVLDIALTIWMIIDIVTIPVALAEIAGAVLAREALIQAVRAETKAEVKAALEAATREFTDITLRRGLHGAMSGSETAEARTVLGRLKQAFWDAGNVPPKQKFTAEQVKQWSDYIWKRMDELGIPKINRGGGLTDVPKLGERAVSGAGKRAVGYVENGESVIVENGKVFFPEGGARGGRIRGGDFNPLEGGEEGGISVHGNVFDRWEGFDLWNQSTYKDRIDAIIAHEWSEFNELSHWETVEMATETKLPISARAKEILRYMQQMGNPGRAFREFNKAEWAAIKAAGKETAPFEEKLKIALALAANGK